MNIFYKRQIVQCSARIHTKSFEFGQQCYWLPEYEMPWEKLRQVRISENIPWLRNFIWHNKWLELETDFSSPSNDEVRNDWKLSLSYPTHFHSVVLK